MENYQNQEVVDQLRLNQNFVMGAIAGLVATILGALIWAGIAVVTEHNYALVSILIGFIVGIAIRKVGKGIDIKFAILGGVCAGLACILGNVFTVFGFMMKAFNLGFSDMFKIITALSLSDFVNMMTETFQPMDLLFYGVAIFEGVKQSRINIKPNANREVSNQL